MYMGFDKKISYWIFLWFLIFYFDYTPYNPFLLLVLGFIFNIIYMIRMYMKKMYLKLIGYSLINVMIKFIPILLLVYDNRDYIDTKSLNFSIILVVIYILYMYLTNSSITKAYSIYEKNNTPLLNIVENSFKKNNIIKKT